MTPQEVIKTFMAKLANHGYTSSTSVGTNMLNDAVKASSDFLSIQNVIDSMKADQTAAEREAVEEVLGSDYAGKTLSDLSSSIRGASAKTYDTNNLGNAYMNSYTDQRTTVERLIKERKAYIFLEKYCGIQLEENYWLTSTNATTAWTGDTTGNVDTGAITGSDANITLTAGDEFYGTTLTSDLMTALAAQDGITLSGDTLIIGTGIEKTRDSVVPEIGNKYTAATAQAQSISTGANDWIVVTGDADDTIITGGADSVVAGGGDDTIIVGANYASIVTGEGSDTVEISAEITNVTLGDLDSNDILIISGTFQVGTAQIEDNLLVVTDKTGTRQIRLGDLDNAKNARVNGTTIATWLSNAGINLNALSSTSSANVIEDAETVEVDGGGRIAIDDEYQPTPTRSNSATEEIQDIATRNSNGTVSVNLDEVTITEGTITADSTTVGTISNEFPNVSSFTKNGLTINLLGVTSDKGGGVSAIQSKTLDQLTDDQKTIVAGLFKWWGKECLKLNEDSYGISFKDSTAMVNEIGLFFYDSGSSGNTLATVWNTNYPTTGETADLKLNVNMKFYKGIAADNVNGESSSTTAFLDRTLAHEFTHAVMGTNIKFFSSLPQFIKEGSAELTHGIDDERGSRIFEVAYDASRLNTALNLSNTGTGTADAYAGGYMFLRYFARQAALQSIAGYENPDAGGSWTISGTTATYKVDGTVVATIKGLAKGLAVKGTAIDGITVSGNVITLSKKVLGTTDVTLTSNNYTLALGDDLSDNVVTFSNKVWTVSNGTATLKGNLTAGYTLLETGKKITYTAAKNNQILATVKGLATTGVSASDFSTNSNVITLKKSMLGTANVTVTGDGYTLALNEDAPEPELQTPYWNVGGTVAAYCQDTTAGFTLAADAKSATYSKLSTTTLAIVNGIQKVTTANKSAIEAAIKINDKVITLGADALTTTKVTVAGDGYTLALAEDAPKPTLQPEYWNLNKTNAFYRQDTSAGFTLAADAKSANYSKLATVTLATVKGIKNVTAANKDEIEADLTVNDKVITLGADALGTTKVTVTGTGYTLALAENAPKPTLQPEYWNLNKTNAFYRQNTSAGFTLANDAKSANYSKLATVTLATVKGIKNVTAANKDEIEADLTVNDKVITLGADALGTTKVTVTGTGYTLALAENAPKSTLQPEYWNLNKTNAFYRQDTSAGFTLAADAKSANYSKLATVTLATVKGIKNVTAANKDEIEADLTVNDKVITLGADALTTTKVTVTGTGYTLALAENAPKPTLQPEYWNLNKTNAFYRQDTSAGFTLAADAKSANYSKLKTVTLATVKGIKNVNAANRDEIASAITISDKIITLGADALATAKVTVAGDGYTLALAENAPKPTLQPEYWTLNKTNAFYRQNTSAGFTLANDAKSANYSKLKTVTLATVKGIKKVNAANKDEIEAAITISDKVITLGADALALNNVTVAGTGYTLAMDSSLTNDTPEERWTISKTNATYDRFRPAHFKASTNNQTFTYNKETKLANLATVKGLISGATVNGDGNVSDKNDNTILTLADTALTLTGDDSFGKKVEVSLANGYTLNNQLTAPAVINTYWAVKNGTAVLKQEKTEGYSTSTNAKTGATILTYEAAKTDKNPLTLATVAGLDKTLTDTEGVFSGLAYDLTGKTITAANSVLTKSNLTLKGDFKLELVTEGNDAVPTATENATLWEVNGTNAVYKDVKIGYFARKNDKAFNYIKETVLATHATISGLRNNAALDSFSLNDNVITLTADALVETPNINTKIALTTKEDYTLKLADGIANVEYNDASWTYSKGTATYKATVKTAGYQPSDDAKTITYIPTVDAKRNAITKTYATVSGVKSANGLTVEDDVIKLTAAALNNRNVTLGKNDPYTLALGDDSLAPAPLTNETWSKSGTKATLTATYSTGYTPSADERTLIYSAKNTVKTLAQISGINSNADINTFQAVADGDTKKISLSAAQLSIKVTVSGEYKFDFASDYNNAAIIGSATTDNISVAGTGLSVTGGKGDDYIDFGADSENLFIYANGDGDDVIADFTANDKIKITNSTPTVASDGDDAIVTVGAGSIKLLGAAGQTITILDANNRSKTYATTAPTSDLLLDDNYSAASHLGEIVKPASATYTPYDFDVQLGIRNEELGIELSFADKK